MLKLRQSPLPSNGVMACRLDLADPRYPEFGFVLDYWNRLRGARIGPARREIDPVDLKAVLPRIGLVDVVRGSADFRFRLVGTEIHNLHHRDITDTLVSRMRPDAYKVLLLEQFGDVAATGRPNAYEIRFVAEAGVSRHYAAIRLPLSSDGRTVDGLLTVDNYGDRWDDLHPYFDQLYERAG